MDFEEELSETKKEEAMEVEGEEFEFEGVKKQTSFERFFGEKGPPKHLTLRNLLIVLVAIIIIATLAFGVIFGCYKYFVEDTSKEEVIGQQTFTYPTAAVAADNAICSKVGSDIMQFANGNAVDAAIGTAICLGVLQPWSSGLGGGGVAVIYLAKEKKYFTVDYREFAPGAADVHMFAEYPSNSTLGGKAIAVPGEVAGYITLWNNYGKAAWKDIVNPSISLAESSNVTALLVEKLEDQEEFIMASPGLASVFAPNGQLLQVGDVLLQPALANSLRVLADDPYSYYNGSIANDLVSDIQSAGGIITSDDLLKYLHEGVHLRDCTSIYYRGMKIIGAPPPFSGGLCTAMAYNLIEPFNFPVMGPNSSLAQHYMIEAWKWAYSDRMALGDPAFVDVEEISIQMQSKDHAALLRQKFSSETTYPPSFYIDLIPEEQGLTDAGTTHLSVVDGEGNVVGMTSTINLYFGSKVLSQSTGIVMNNEMDDFSSPDQYNYFGIPDSEANYIAPYKKPLSSMNPTIVFLNDEFLLVAGAAGGPTIITSVFQTVINVIDFNFTIGDAIGRARCHDQDTGETKVEEAYSSSFIDFLTSTHHNITSQTSPIAVVQGIKRNSDGSLSAASDWRKYGLPAGF